VGAGFGIMTTMSDPSFLKAIRSSYDTVAASYSALVRDDLPHQPTERSLLTLFAELAAPHSTEVADVGCGPGQITAFLSEQGLKVVGIDLSPAMIELARATYPSLSFEIGSMTALARPDASLSGVLGWLSIIHIPDDELPSVVAEFERVLLVGAPLMLAFQVGDAASHLTERWGHAVDLTLYRRRPEAVAELLSHNGFHVHLQTVFEPAGRPGMQVAVLIARKGE
jgi:ubiquinone/menaquinone biosynthesis C-methylase UbiE